MTIYEARKHYGLSQAQLARRLNCAQPTLSHWERGDRKPTRKYSAALRELGIDPDNIADPQGRDRDNEALLCEWEVSGATIKSIALKHGLHPNTVANRLDKAEKVRRRERIRAGLRR